MREVREVSYHVVEFFRAMNGWFVAQVMLMNGGAAYLLTSAGRSATTLYGRSLLAIGGMVFGAFAVLLATLLFEKVVRFTARLVADELFETARQERHDFHGFRKAAQKPRGKDAIGFRMPSDE